jgi:hypothetical protein
MIRQSLAKLPRTTPRSAGSVEMSCKPIPVNETFGRWTVLGFSPRRNGKTFHLCRCLCGTVKPVERRYLLDGRSPSCGCLRREKARKHGMYKSAEYQSYKDARKRCTSPRRKEYKHYGGRGIQFLYKSFEEFIADVGLRPTPNHSIDRIDNDGHYEPGNVRWATPSEQRKNRRTPRTYQKS